MKRAAAAAWLALGIAVPAGAADLFNGRQIYAAHCTACHGPNGAGVMPGVPNLARGDRMMQADAGLLAAIRAGRNAMPAYAGVLRDREILDVIAYLRTLR